MCYADDDLSLAQRVTTNYNVFTYADDDLHAVSMVINMGVK